MGVSLAKVDLEKHETEVKKVVSLLKLADVKARVVIVADGSGSISGVFRRGTMHNAFVRSFAVARQFDDNGELDAFVFSDEFVRLPAVTLDNFENYVQEQILDRFQGGRNSRKTNELNREIERVKEALKPSGGFLGFGKKKPENESALNAELKRLEDELPKENFQLFRGNNEVDVMNEVIRYYTKEDPSSLPTYIIFISDGGVYKNNEIKKIIRSSSNLPIFWQFVGLGKANYGALEELDTLDGRVVDNANFFELDDIDQITDEELYKRLLGEFPKWIQEAKSKGIL